jgi:hypothetical protein
MVLPCAVQAAAARTLIPGLRYPTERSGTRTRTSCPMAGWYSQILETASGAPNDHSLATTMFPLGVSFRPACGRLAAPHEVDPLNLLVAPYPGRRRHGVPGPGGFPVVPSGLGCRGRPWCHCRPFGWEAV